MKENKNMDIYNLVRNVPEEAKKEFNNGSFSGTDINPQWRIQMLTEIFGPCGFGWYYTIDKQWFEQYENIVKAFCNISLYVKQDGEWSKPIQGTGGNFFTMPSKVGIKVSDECYKMALTDALSIACKALGIGADVWYKDGKTKYTQNTDNMSIANPTKPTIDNLLAEARKALADAKTKKECQEVYTNPKYAELRPKSADDTDKMTWYYEVNNKQKSLKA